MFRNVIYGPPGTGKSTTIARLVGEYLVSGIKQESIGICSYTKAAASVLADKCNIVTPWLGTLHSIAFSLINLDKNQVISHIELESFFSSSGIPFSGGNPDNPNKELDDGDYYIAIYHKHKALLADNIEDTYDNEEQPGTRQDFLSFVDKYETWKDAYGFIDYTDMLLRALDIDPPLLDVLFVDEAQDLSPLQWKLVNKWAEKIQYIHIAGDDDQAIYAWAGADPKGMSVFEQKHAATRTILEQSYRLRSEIHCLAVKLIQQVDKRVDKPYRFCEGESEVTDYTDYRELEFEHGEDVLVLYRNHNLRRNIEKMLRDMGIPYVTDNGKIGYCQTWQWELVKLFKQIQKNGYTSELKLSKKELRLFEAGLYDKHKYLLPLTNVEDQHNGAWLRDIFNYDFEYVFNLGRNYIEYFKKLEEIDFYLEITPTIHLSTIHGAKGKEAERVVLLNGMGNKASLRYSFGDKDSELRVFYVGITRAKHKLDIVHIENCLEELMLW